MNSWTKWNNKNTYVLFTRQSKMENRAFRYVRVFFRAYSNRFNSCFTFASKLRPFDASINVLLLLGLFFLCSFLARRVINCFTTIQENGRICCFANTLSHRKFHILTLQAWNFDFLIISIPVPIWTRSTGVSNISIHTCVFRLML